MKDIAFFGKNTRGVLYRIPPNASDFDILHATNATMKLDNQKNGWKGVCVNHEHNGDARLCGVRALARRYLHIRNNTSVDTTPLSTYFSGPIRTSARQ